MDSVTMCEVEQGNEVRVEEDRMAATTESLTKRVLSLLSFFSGMFSALLLLIIYISKMIPPTSKERYMPHCDGRSKIAEGTPTWKG